MASVVFEKQLANINKGLQALRSMNKELNKFEKGSNSTKMLKGAIKSLKEAESSVKSMALEAHMVSFDKAHKSLNRFNNGLKHTKKYLDSIYGKLKMIGFASMAGIGSIAAMGAAMGSGAKSQVAHTTKAKTLSNMSGRSLDILKQMGNKQGDENLIVGMYENLLNAVDNGSIALSTFGLNQDDIIKGLNSTNIQDRVKTLDKVVKALESYKDYTTNSHFNDLSQELLGVGIREAIAYQQRAGGSFTDQFNAISAKTNDKAGSKTTIYKNVEAVGQAFIDLQYTLSQFNDWFVSNFKTSFEAGFNGVSKALETIKNSKTISNKIQDFSKNIEVYITQGIGHFFESVMNIPNYLATMSNLLDKIHLAVKSVKDSIFYVFTDLGDKLSQVEWWFPGVGKFNPFGTLKPSQESLANMYADKIANTQSAINIKEREKEILQSRKENALMWAEFLPQNRLIKSAALEAEIKEKDVEMKKLKQDLQELKQQSINNNITINIDKDGKVEAKSEGFAKNIIVNTIGKITGG